VVSTRRQLYSSTRAAGGDCLARSKYYVRVWCTRVRCRGLFLVCFTTRAPCSSFVPGSCERTSCFSSRCSSPAVFHSSLGSPVCLLASLFLVVHSPSSDVLLRVFICAYSARERVRWSSVFNERRLRGTFARRFYVEVRGFFSGRNFATHFLLNRCVEVSGACAHYLLVSVKETHGTMCAVAWAKCQGPAQPSR